MTPEFPTFLSIGPVYLGANRVHILVRGSWKGQKRSR